jgi:uncharacterized membrane protein YwaF
MFGLSDGALGAASDVARAAVAASTDDVNTMAVENLKNLVFFLYTFLSPLSIFYLFVKINFDGSA